MKKKIKPIRFDIGSVHVDIGWFKGTKPIIFGFKLFEMDGCIRIIFGMYIAKFVIEFYHVTR